MTPSPVDTPCASQTNGLTPCSGALFLSHRQAPPPLTHTFTQAHTLPPTHTASHTLTHYSYTPHSPSLTHIHPHILLTHLNTSLAHFSHTPQTHTLFTPTYTLTHTHPHTLTHTHSSYPHTHTPTHTPHLHTYTHITHTQSQSLQERRRRKHRDPGAVLTHQACGVCGNSPESQLSSVTGPSTHWEPLGLLEAP